MTSTTDTTKIAPAYVPDLPVCQWSVWCDHPAIGKSPALMLIDGLAVTVDIPTCHFCGGWLPQVAS